MKLLTAHVNLLQLKDDQKQRSKEKTEMSTINIYKIDRIANFSEMRAIHNDIHTLWQFQVTHA